MPIIARCAPGVPAAAALARELLADVVPDVLGVDQHAVEVEDHGRRSQRGVPPVVVDERAGARPKLEPPHLADEEHVVAGRRARRRCRRRSSRRRPRAAAGRPRGPRSRPRARSAARCARSAARGDPDRRRGSRSPTPPASRSTSKSDADAASEMPTSGGSSESESSDETVSPARRRPPRRRRPRHPTASGGRGALVVDRRGAHGRDSSGSGPTRRSAGALRAPGGESAVERSGQAARARVVAASVRIRSGGATSSCRPRRPAETRIVSKPSADSSTVVGKGRRWPSGLMPPAT